MDWKSTIHGFESYLLLERSLSGHSIEAYQRDVSKLATYALSHAITSPTKINSRELEAFITHSSLHGISARSQARMISGLKAFFKYLLIENLITNDPTELLEGPKLSRKIPEFLTIEEMERVLSAIDFSHEQGQRNRAILETLYSCGLRVTELINLRISHYYPNDGIVRVIGKNNKERICPIGSEAIKHIDYYLEAVRRHMSKIQKGSEDILFLNRRGRKLSRVMIFHIVKEVIKDTGIQKNVSPHTFRHSFATHMVEGGADLKAVQDMLGHESITTTEIYTHLDTKYLRDTILLYHPRNN